MSASPKYKVFTPGNQYAGSAKDPILAAVMADFLGDCASVRIGHARSLTVWTAGTPNEGWDDVAEHIAGVEERIRANYAAVRGGAA